VKAPNLSVRSPAPAVSATATVIKLLGLEKSTAGILGDNATKLIKISSSWRYASGVTLAPAAPASYPRMTAASPCCTGESVDYP
jgi:hypothetical protein